MRRRVAGVSGRLAVVRWRRSFGVLGRERQRAGLVGIDTDRLEEPRDDGGDRIPVGVVERSVAEMSRRIEAMRVPVTRSTVTGSSPWEKRPAVALGEVEPEVLLDAGVGWCRVLRESQDGTPPAGLAGGGVEHPCRRHCETPRGVGSLGVVSACRGDRLSDSRASVWMKSSRSTKWL